MFPSWSSSCCVPFYPAVCVLLRKTQFKVVVQLGPFLIRRNICMVFPFCLMLGVMILVVPDGKEAGGNLAAMPEML